MKAIANQPVNFINEILCNSCDEDIPQLSDNTDTVQVQFNIDNCGSIQMMQNFIDHQSNDWVLEDGWAISGGLLCLSGIEPQTAYQTIPASTFPAGLYVFTIIVSSYSGIGTPVKVGNNTDGFDTIGTIDGVGTFNFYYTLVIASNILFPNVFIFVPGEQGESMCISSVTAYNILTDAKIAVYTEAGTYVTQITYVENPALFVFYQNSLTVTIKWSTLPVPIANGCYYLCFLDPCLNTGGQNYIANIVNPNIVCAESPFGWALEGSAGCTNGKIVFDGTDYGFIYQPNVFANYANQCIDIGIVSSTGNIVVSFGTAVVATIPATATPILVKVCGVPVGNLSLTIAVANTTIATIELVYPSYITPEDSMIFDPAFYTCNLQSNNFKIGNYTNACTLLISAYNNENGLGFVFANFMTGLLFNPKIRLEAKIKGLKYPAERSVLEDSLGAKNVYYFAGRKAKTLAIDLQPEYVHDFLRLLIGFDNWYIDGVVYFVEDDEYSVNISDVHDSVGSVKLLVSTRTQNVKNFNCS